MYPPVVEFSTLNTDYLVSSLGFGLLAVARIPRPGAPVNASLPLGFTAQAAEVVPIGRGRSPYEERVVRFTLPDGETITTSYADRRACELPWSAEAHLSELAVW